MKKLLLSGLLACVLATLSGCASDSPKSTTTTTTTEETTVHPLPQ